LGTLTIIYGSVIEPQLLIVNKQEDELQDITEPIKIAFIADFQVGPYKRTEYVKKTVKKIVELKPDIVLLGGDHVDNGGTWEDETKYLVPLIELAKNTPTFAIPGNHEYGVGNDISIVFFDRRLPDVSKQTGKAMTDLKINYLTNELRQLTINGQSVNLFGGDSSMAQKLNFSALKNRNLNIPTIALLHDPLDVITASTFNIDLVLSGHTHGGQIRLPFFGPLGRAGSRTPLSWYKGWNEYNNTKFFVTSGVGETGVRSRLFNPPEIVLLTIK